MTQESNPARTLTIREALDVYLTLGREIKRVGKAVDKSLTQDITLHFARSNPSKLVDLIENQAKVLDDMRNSRSNTPEELSEYNTARLNAVTKIIGSDLI